MFDNVNEVIEYLRNYLDINDVQALGRGSLNLEFENEVKRGIRKHLWNKLGFEANKIDDQTIMNFITININDIRKAVLVKFPVYARTNEIIKYVVNKLLKDDLNQESAEMVKSLLHREE